MLTSIAHLQFVADRVREPERPSPDVRPRRVRPARGLRRIRG
jgi:hypothetical protein